MNHPDWISIYPIWNIPYLDRRTALRAEKDNIINAISATTVAAIIGAPSNRNGARLLMK